MMTLRFVLVTLALFRPGVWVFKVPATGLHERVRFSRPTRYGTQDGTTLATHDRWVMVTAETGGVWVLLDGTRCLQIETTTRNRFRVRGTYQDPCGDRETAVPFTAHRRRSR